MNEIPTSLLYVILVVLIAMSAFFSSSETSLLSLNRYRLKHLAKNGHSSAQKAQGLLKSPDKLIGLILLGNNFVNVLASQLATIIALREWGDVGIAIAGGILTLVILIFAEVTPKTFAAINPEKIAFPASWVLGPLMTALYPFVWLVNQFANGLLKLLKVDPLTETSDNLNREELRTIVKESATLIPRRHQNMLVNILDLEEVTVDDIMVPRNEIIGIDVSEDWDEILNQLTHSQFTRLPVYNQHIDEVVGFLHMRKIMNKLARGEFTQEDMESTMREVYFIPESTPLPKALLNFQRERRRIAMVVDEYGDVMGLVTLEDILEEIVGEFTSDPLAYSKDVHPHKDGGFIVDGSATIRDLNRLLRWNLPVDGPKTFNGLILEHLESIPEPGTSLKLFGHPVEIVQVKNNAVKTAKVQVPLRRKVRRIDTAIDAPID